MKIKTTLKKLKRGDVVSIDWIDAGDLDDSPSRVNRDKLKLASKAFDDPKICTNW